MCAPTRQAKNDPPLLGSWNKHTGSCDDPALNDLLFLLVNNHQVVAVQFGGLFDDHVLLRDGVVVTEHWTGGREGVSLGVCTCVCVCVCMQNRYDAKTTNSHA